jgi:3-oxoacyl-[acyl-carrier protein] reductase
MTSTSSTTPRVALVTGGSGGIGKAVVERLAEDGFALAVHYAGNKAKADALVEQITASGGQAVAVGGDVADEEAMAAAFDAAETAFGGIDVVVNTAGIMVLAPIATLNEHPWHLRRLPAGRPPRTVRWRDHQRVHVGHAHPAAHLRGVRRQ